MTLRLDSISSPMYHAGMNYLRGQFDVKAPLQLEVYSPPRIADGVRWAQYFVSRRVSSIGVRKAWLDGAVAHKEGWKPASVNTQPRVESEQLASFQWWKTGDVDWSTCVTIRVRQNGEVSGPVMVNRPELWFYAAQDHPVAPGSRLTVYGRSLASTPYGLSGKFFLQPKDASWALIRELRSEAAVGELQPPFMYAADSCQTVVLPDDLLPGDYLLFAVTDDTVWATSDPIALTVGAPVEATEFYAVLPTRKGFWTQAELEKEIQTAMAASLPLGAARCLRLPEGKFLLDRPLLVPPGLGIVGAGEDTKIIASPEFVKEWKSPPWMGCYTLNAVVILQSGCSLANLHVSTGVGDAVAAVAVWHTASGPEDVVAKNVVILGCKLTSYAERGENSPGSSAHGAAAILVHSPVKGLTIVENQLEGFTGIEQNSPAQDFIVMRNEFKPSKEVGRVGTTMFGGVFGQRGLIAHNRAEDANRGLVAQPGFTGSISQMAIVGNIFRGGLINYDQGESCLLEYIDEATRIFDGQGCTLVEPRTLKTPADYRWPAYDPTKLLTVVIADGPGRGQWRRVSRASALADGSRLMTFPEAFDSPPTAESRVWIGFLPVDLFFFANRYENSKGGFMLGDAACGVVSVADEWIQSRDGIYLNSVGGSLGFFDVCFLRPTLVDSALSLHVNGDPKGFPISGVRVEFGRFVRSPIYWATRGKGIEGLALTECDFDDYWGAPGHTFIRDSFTPMNTPVSWGWGLQPLIPIFGVRYDASSRPTLADIRIERCRRNNENMV